MVGDAVLIIFIAICTALLGEGKTIQKHFKTNKFLKNKIACLYRLVFVLNLGLTYVLVYRSDKYKRLKLDIERKTKRRKFYGSKNYSDALFQYYSFVSKRDIKGLKEWIIEIIVERKKDQLSEIDRTNKRKIGMYCLMYGRWKYVRIWV